MLLSLGVLNSGLGASLRVKSSPLPHMIRSYVQVFTLVYAASNSRHFARAAHISHCVAPAVVSVTRCVLPHKCCQMLETLPNLTELCATTARRYCLLLAVQLLCRSGWYMNHTAS